MFAQATKHAIEMLHTTVSVDILATTRIEFMGSLHNTDGPAEIWYDGFRKWSLYGTPMTESEFKLATGRVKEYLW